MNNNIESRLEKLSAGLDASAPAGLEYTVSRARARYDASRRQSIRRRKLFGIPAGSIAMMFICFVIAVNSSITFAHAVGRLPVLKELARAVALSPSLKAAVDNEYVQPVGLSYEQDGVRLSIEYIIVDMKQVNVFYSLEKLNGNGRADKSVSLLADVDVTEKMEGFASHGSYSDSEIKCHTFDFMDGGVPDSLSLSFSVWQMESSYKSEPVRLDTPAGGQYIYEPDYIAVFDIFVSFDPEYTVTGRVLEIDKWFELDGQSLLIKSVEIYPTHMRLELDDHPDNTMWLKGLEFYIPTQDTDYTKITNGITSSGSEDSPFTPSHRLESAYFGEVTEFEIVFTGARWLEKDREQITVEYGSGLYNTPLGIDNVDINRLERQGTGLLVELLIHNGENGFYDPIQPTFISENGDELFIHSHSLKHTDDIPWQPSDTSQPSDDDSTQSNDDPTQSNDDPSQLDDEPTQPNDDFLVTYVIPEYDPAFTSVTILPWFTRCIEYTESVTVAVSS